MIKRVRLENFQTHVDTTVELGRLTMLVGPNGAGKSSVLRALDTICKITPGGVRPLPQLTRSVRIGSDGFTITLEAHDFTGTLSLKRDSDGDWSGQRDQDPPPTRSRFTIPAAYLQMDIAKLAEPSPVRQMPRISHDGGGLASVVADMRLRGAEQLEAMVADLRLMVPQARDLRVRVVDAPGAIERGLAELVLDFEGARGVPASTVSEGTLIALGLLTVLHDPEPPQLLLLDDIDRGLHPKAQWELIGILRRLLERSAELQVVATTHSPYLLDELRPDEVRVLALDRQGVTRCRALTEHPNAQSLLEVLSTGEMLGSEGEDWVLEVDAGA